MSPEGRAVRFVVGLVVFGLGLGCYLAVFAYALLVTP